MTGKVSIFGIRHHGPGSARRLVEALDSLSPAAVLIEGPSDLSGMLPLLADPAMVTPVALLAYAEDDPANASFLPFEEYSPEYQAALWAVRHGVALRFIDLPAQDRLAPERSEADAPVEGPDGDADPLIHDPIGVLARAAGYDDGESWWRDVIEENPSPGPVFAAVADAMAALRSEAGQPGRDEAAREAHMRLEIARATNEIDGQIAVVCGAWHVPALTETHTMAADRRLLKGRPRTRIKATWAPWTEARLARSSGYGAGVVAPAWCTHLWRTAGQPERDGVWLARIAQLMRDHGHFVSTASVIETHRLGTALAALRGRPAPGFEEWRDASISCLCFGERILWEQIASDLLIGARVGAIPETMPLAPLLDDLQRQQRAARLKPEALERELSVDLRSESGLLRSTLLHRLNAIDVPWGRLTDAGGSRGTFREKWVICWEPEYAVRLVENLVYGSTIEEAASTRISEAMGAEPSLDALAGLVRSAMVADLPKASSIGIEALSHQAALTSDCGALLRALPPMADVVRYGEARAGAAEKLGQLMPRMVVQAALALPYAARNLDAAASATLSGEIRQADGAIRLAQMDGDVLDGWHRALRHTLEDSQTTTLVAGSTAQLLYEAQHLDAEEAATLLARMLSPGTQVTDAAGFFEGFFEGAGNRLVHDQGLRTAVDAWLLQLEEEDFVAHLPLFRRVFSTLDRSERRRLMDALFVRRRAESGGLSLVPDADAVWSAQFPRLLALLEAGRRR